MNKTEQVMNNLPQLRIDIISDVMCPWCVVGYMGLQQALEQLNDEMRADIHWQPFELNPNMPAEGQELSEHIMEKYGNTAEQSRDNRNHLIAMGKSLGFEFNFTDDKRIYNTFNAHQLLHWVKEQFPERQTELKLALLTAYFTDGRNVSDVDVLMAIVEELGFDSAFARQLLDDQVYAGDVRALQEQWRQLGVSAVPSFIIDEKYILSGGQPAEAFVHSFRQILEQQ